MTKGAVALVKDVRQLGVVAYFRTQSRRNLHRFYGRAQKSWDEYDEYDSRKLHSVKANMRENKGPSLGKIQVKNSSSAQSLRLKMRGPISGRDRKTRAMCARGDAWKLAKNIFQLKETEKATVYSPSDEWVFPATSTIQGVSLVRTFSNAWLGPLG